MAANGTKDKLVGTKMTETKRQNVKICFLATAAFSLVANAFAYFNLTPHHDSINHIFHFAGTWEISL